MTSLLHSVDGIVVCHHSGCVNVFSAQMSLPFSMIETDVKTELRQKISQLKTHLHALETRSCEHLLQFVLCSMNLHVVDVECMV